MDDQLPSSSKNKILMVFIGIADVFHCKFFPLFIIFYRFKVFNFIEYLYCMKEDLMIEGMGHLGSVADSIRVYLHQSSGARLRVPQPPAPLLDGGAVVFAGF
jgi:hypothetical protein